MNMNKMLKSVSNCLNFTIINRKFTFVHGYFKFVYYYEQDVEIGNKLPNFIYLFFRTYSSIATHTNAVAIFLVGEAAIRCLEIHEYLHF